jgi:hypothetical protein
MMWPAAAGGGEWMKINYPPENEKEGEKMKKKARKRNGRPETTGAVK